MEENKYDFKPEENLNNENNEEKFDYLPEEDYDQDREDYTAIKKSILGYRVVVILLVIILAGVSVLYFNLNRQSQLERAKREAELEAQHRELEIERDTIASHFAALRKEYDDLGVKNDSIAAELHKGDSIIAQLKKERRLNYATINKYKKEVGTLRAVMKTYLHQLDSVNEVNKSLVNKNIALNKEITTERLRAEKAEEKNKENENRLRQAAVLNARGITITALNAKQRAVTRIKQATSFSVGFTIAANTTAQPGNRKVYLCIYNPDGHLIGSSSFSYNGKNKGCTASREVSYQNEDLGVNIFYHDSGKNFVPGTYKVELYMDGRLLGRTSKNFE